MTLPQATPPETGTSNSKLLRAAIWVAIGALIAAAFVCVIMVLVGSTGGLVGRAFLTILLMVAFAGVAILDTYLAPRRPVWFALTSMVVWVVTLLVGAVMIWLPFRDFISPEFGGGAGRFMSFLLIVLILQLGVLHVRLYVKAWERNRTPFTNAVATITIVLVALLAAMLVFPLMLREWVHFYDIYWRLTVSVAILAAVGTALLPLVNALFAPRRSAYTHGGQGWPTYADGATPLPVLANGQPDWNAYYTGYPTEQPAGQDAAAAPHTAAWPAPEQAPAIAPETAPAAYGDDYASPAAPDWPAPEWPAPERPPAAPTSEQPPAAPAPEQPPAAPAAEQPPAAPVPEPPQPATPTAEQPPAAPGKMPTAPGYQGFPPPPPLPDQR